MTTSVYCVDFADRLGYSFLKWRLFIFQKYMTCLTEHLPFIGERFMGFEIRASARDPVPPGDIIHGLVAFRESRRAFEITTTIGAETYEFSADRILTHRAFTDWVWQLYGKGWMSGQHFVDLFACLSDFIYRGWNEYPQSFYEVTDGVDELDKV